MLVLPLITRQSAKYYCRTCLGKLNIDDVQPSVENLENKLHYINIADDADLEQIITINIGDEEQIRSCMPNVCLECYNKLLDFAKFRQKAQESARALLTICRHEDNDAGRETIKMEETNRRPERKCKNGRKNYLDEEPLLETESAVFLEDDIQVEKFDTSTPDPFCQDEPTIATDPTNLLLLKCESLEEARSEECFDSDPGIDPKEVYCASTKGKKKRERKKLVSTLTRPRTAAYRCEKCKSRFARKQHYDAHIRKVHEGSTHPYACDQCEKSYKASGALRYHVYVAHQLGSERFQCTECGRAYKTEQSLRTHRNEKHMGKKRKMCFICELCGATLPNQKVLEIHRKAKHSTNVDGDCSSEYKCEHCDKPFQSPYTLKYHMLREHLQQKTCECSVCGVGFAKQFMLAAHMRVHLSAEDKFPCNQCDKRFLSKSDANKHVQMVHLKIKPHVCNYCGDAFATPKTLRHHVYIHTGEKPYACEVCGQSFRQLTSMKNHRKTHLKKL